MPSHLSGLPRDPAAGQSGIRHSGLRSGLGTVVSLQPGAVRQPGPALRPQPQPHVPQVTDLHSPAPQVSLQWLWWERLTLAGFQ